MRENCLLTQSKLLGGFLNILLSKQLNFAEIRWIISDNEKIYSNERYSCGSMEV